jgi:molybdenum cofactor guanylyltransferase
VWAAVVLAGGRSSRLGGRHKPGLPVAGRTLLDHALTAVSAAAATVVVGPEVPTCRPVRWTREDPPGGGPVAGLAAGLAALTVDAAEVAVLAADLPGLTPATLDRLRAASTADGALLCDANGRRQWLIGVWRTEAVRRALPADPAGRSLRSVLGTLTGTDVPELPGESADVDTPADLARVTEGRTLGSRAGEGEPGAARR